jgi:hypothetical protein
MIANRTKPSIEKDKGSLRQAAAKSLNFRLDSRLSVGMAMSVMSLLILVTSVNLATLWSSAENKVIGVSNQAAVYYDDVRLVCQITHRLRRLQEQEETCGHRGESLRAEATRRPTAR